MTDSSADPTRTARASQAPERRKRGFEAASSLLRDQIRTAGESRGFALSRLLTHWTEVVGTDLAAAAHPVKIGYGKGGLGATLTLLVAGANAPLVQMQLPKIRDRVNACYGYNAISRISLAQTDASGFAEAQKPFGHQPAAADHTPDPVKRAAAEALSRDVHDETLRAALEALGEKVLSRTR
ncbi:MAG: DUF721 domain-containing protein [Paracoccaceae bacterium]|jgi:hypothetical protein